MNVPIEDDELVDHIASHLCEEQADALEGMSDDQIESRVRQGLARARASGFTDPEPATAFVTLMFLVSPCFDRHAAIAAAIRSAQGEPAERLRALFARTKESDWDEAASAGTWEDLA